VTGDEFLLKNLLLACCYRVLMQRDNLSPAWSTHRQWRSAMWTHPGPAKMVRSLASQSPIALHAGRVGHDGQHLYRKNQKLLLQRTN